MKTSLTKGVVSGGPIRTDKGRTAKEPRRQWVGVVGIGTLALIIGQENVDRAINIDGKNRRTAKERRKDE